MNDPHPLVVTTSTRRHFSVIDATVYGIIRHAHGDPRADYQKVPNSIARDGELSFGAIGLLVYLRSHQEGFNVNAKALSRTFKSGEAAIRTYMSELVARGYLRKEREHGRDGRLGDWLWTLTEPDDDLGAGTRAQAVDHLRAGTPGLDNTSAGQPPPHKKTNVKKTNVKKTRLNAARAASDEEAEDEHKHKRPWTTGDPIHDGTAWRLNDALLTVSAYHLLSAQIEHLRSLPDWSAVAQHVARWCGIQAAVKNGAAPGPLVSALVGGEHIDSEEEWAAFLASSTPPPQPGVCRMLDSGYCDLHGRRDHARL